MKHVLFRSAVLLLVIVAPALRAQSIGTVATGDADITNPAGALLPATNGRASLSASGTIAAHSHTAELALSRGGTVHVCRGTTLHAAEAPTGNLLFSIDRGALELRTKATPADALVTPDLRLTPQIAGTLDLQIRVSPSGDTCLDNRGHHAPPLNIVDAFGQSSYLLKPGQHVSFEHGSLREVVDRETVPCGCPPDDAPQKPGVPVAEALLRGGGTQPSPQQAAAAANPFPTAVSEGLAEPSPIPAETPGTLHTQVSSTLTFDPATNPRPVAALPPPAVDLPPPAPAAKPGAFSALGRFFKRIFVR